jgi:hypothetical protein
MGACTDPTLILERFAKGLIANQPETPDEVVEQIEQPLCIAPYLLVKRGDGNGESEKHF